MPLIKIPFALDASHKLVGIEHAERDVPYYCPSCNRSVIVRKGNIRVHHFSHKADNSCSQETAIHKLCKLLIRDRFSNWFTGQEDPPTVQRFCVICGSEMRIAFPSEISSVSIEERLSNGYIPDVVLYDLRKPVAAIEVRVTHAVDEHKVSELTIPFIEVAGTSVLLNSSNYEPLVDTFPSIQCPECVSRLPKYLEKAKTVALASNLTIPEKYFRYRISNCWHCDQEILCFTFPGSEDNADPLQPAPRVLRKFPFKRGGGFYWSNVCPFCGRHQGIPSLYVAKRNELYLGECGQDTEEEFRMDLMKLAYDRDNELANK